MALEIERRFLVKGDDWRRHISWQARLQQGYLVAGGADGITVRVRSAGGGAAVAGAWLTLKARSAAGPGPGAEAAPALPEGLVRQEFEYPIPAEDAEALQRCREDLLYVRHFPKGAWRVGREGGGAGGRGMRSGRPRSAWRQGNRAS